MTIPATGELPGWQSRGPQSMLANPPETTSLTRLREAASRCTACPLFAGATQTVFGEGAGRPKYMLVGEQPGDIEDREGHPFVGPAGKLLFRALDEAGIDQRSVYITNAVKHFKWEPRGKRRIHKKPNTAEVTACRPWLDHEISIIKPELIICLGASAARSVLRRTITVAGAHGLRFPTEWGIEAVVITHPSALLRIPRERLREIAYKKMVRFFEEIRRIP